MCLLSVSLTPAPPPLAQIHQGGVRGQLVYDRTEDASVQRVEFKDESFLLELAKEGRAMEVLGNAVVVADPGIRSVTFHIFTRVDVSLVSDDLQLCPLLLCSHPPLSQDAKTFLAHRFSVRINGRHLSEPG
jgi:hypothetical protein